MKVLTLRGPNVPLAIKNRTDFTASHMIGENVSGWFASGLLRGADLERFRRDAPGIVYVVRSYGTPIAWVTVDGSAYRVEQRFSQSTRRHQGLTYLIGGEA